MRAGLVGVAVILVLSGCGGSADPPGGRLVATLGDSITAGSPAYDPDPRMRDTLGFGADEKSQWQYWVHRAHPELRFRNCGVYGQRTDEIARRLDECAKGARLLVVQGGINDIAQGRPVETAAANLRSMVRRGKELGLEVAMISGDDRRTAEAVGRELGIDRVFAEVLPQDKADYVARLQQEGKKVAMVGDGVNDAPALAQADVGIAIGAGTDVAIETANVVLMRSDPLDVAAAMQLSRATVRKMKQNLGWASVYNVMAIPIAAGVLFPSAGIELRPEWSALLMSVSSIIVATNAVLLKRVERELPRIASSASPSPAR